MPVKSEAAGRSRRYGGGGRNARAGRRSRTYSSTSGNRVQCKGQPMGESTGTFG